MMVGAWRPDRLRLLGVLEQSDLSHVAMICLGKNNNALDQSKALSFAYHAVS